MCPMLDTQKLTYLLAYFNSAPHSTVFKELYLTCFFSILRLSNKLPHSVATFDNTRHLVRGDFISAGQGAVLLLKWSKTIQDHKSTLTIPLPNLQHSTRCRIKAINLMIQAIPATSNDPLFASHTSRGLASLTDSLARKHLKKCLQCPVHFTCTYISCIQKGSGFLDLQSWGSTGTYYEAWNMEVRCHLDLFVFLHFHCFPRICCLSGSPTQLVLLGPGCLSFLKNYITT